MDEKKQSANIIDLLGCKYIPAINSGDNKKDNYANTELYLRLLKEGEKEEFCPVLIDKETRHYIYEPQYGYTDSKEDYPKISRILIERAERSCFEVWVGKLIYNYYLDGLEYEEDVAVSLNELIPPNTIKYNRKFEKCVEKEFIFGKNSISSSYNFSFEELVFALVPVKRPWELLAWIPMGGFNWCPNAEHQVALAKGLYEQFGARIAYISFSAVEYYIPSPLLKKEDVEKAAKVLMAADMDVYQDFEVAVDLILGSHIWHLWWD